jgi:hypothetical protein
MTSHSKGTIQGYNGIAINDNKHQIILQAQTWGSVGEQQTLKPAITQLQEQLKALDRYIADTQFRSRNPLFKISETYHTEKEKRRLKRSKGRPRLFTSKDFHYDKNTKSCRARQGMKCGVAAIS